MLNCSEVVSRFALSLFFGPIQFITLNHTCFWSGGFNYTTRYSIYVQVFWIDKSNASLVPVVLKQAREKTRMYSSTRLGPRCDVTAKGASERLADFSIFNMAGNLYIQVTL
jgi:hypothetical protein